ncbi:hypothetical protein FNV43_RR05991 [Rhamnella rubrinervis]|uniref:MCM3-like winged helix domain-containing protein n=1 Tax=Rhamnella rubrinervis TaxID=2594499 RepID=A0A8K0HC68_9ROSA|nr:hypothetical protein FNV43_RR05991 [Rhamnella rubrinervis]
MEIDDPPAQSASDLSPERIEAFKSSFNQHMRSNRLDDISIENVEEAVNSRVEVGFSRQEIVSLLEKLQNEGIVMVVNGKLSFGGFADLDLSFKAFTINALSEEIKEKA